MSDTLLIEIGRSFSRIAMDPKVKQFFESKGVIFVKCDREYIPFKREE